MKIKIVFFLPGLHGGGAEKVAVNLLRKLDKEVYDIFLVLTEKEGKYLELISPHIKIHDLKVKKTMLSILKLRKKILDIKPDIIFSTLFRTHIAIDLALIGLKHKPKIIYRSPNSPKLLLENKELSFLMKYLLERAYRNADTIIAQTPEMKNEIEQYHSINKNKIIVMLNPIDTEHIDKCIQNTATPFDDDYINVVATGRLTKQKGFDILIKSFKKVIAVDERFRLFILGEESSFGEKEKLKRIVTENNLEEYISFLGFQKNPYKYFYHADLYVLSSRWEGLPNTVLENLYLKKPIIATRCIPFMDTLIENGKNGMLVNIEDEEALSDAITNYKIIDINYETISFNSSQIESIFDEK